MSKRYRFFIILGVVGLCFVFLLPTIRWYFLTPRESQVLALASREQIKIYASRMAQVDLQALIQDARDDKELAEKLSFLVSTARKYNKQYKRRNPDVWNSRSLLRSFPGDEEGASALVLDAIETKYREDIFALKDLQSSAVQLGLDLSGGMSIVLQADMASLSERLGRSLNDADRTDAVNRALEVLNSRIDRFGLTEPVIRRQGDDQIYVEIPGTADPERINSIIMGKGGLAFHIVDEEETARFRQYYNQHPTDTFNGQGELINPEIVSADTVVRGVYEKDRYGLDEFQEYTVIKKTVGLDGNHIQSAVVDRDNIEGTPRVSFQLDSEGGEIFYQLTSANVGKYLAIVLDDRVKSQAVIRGAIRDSVQLSGRGIGQEEAENIALILRTAALPVELEVVNQQNIGASMGEDAINQGFWALIGGLALVMVFLLVFYKEAGVNAVIAQLLNFYLMGSILSAFNFTLTLPSIAGFILTIGMAVDANVIIFERIKEEIRQGKDRKAAIGLGFDKAFWAIMDSNITTFIAALFLSQLGSGPIQGFAVSLAVGVFSSVFTALFVSKLLFDFGSDVLKQRKIAILWGSGK
ncbi:MAG: protein translocase subunit SecD [Spirochaetaceae bacterium]|jgi:preprotein translocase subunit SecD|nr:protein translocase subunit SecD [Spirochaetaceae bacterium]